MKRSKAEWIFIVLFVPAVVGFYSIYKYPAFFFGEGADTRLLGKNLSFWYSLVYTAIVCGIAAKVLWQGTNTYSFRANVTQPLSPYQKKKFTSIFLVQAIVFFLVPYVVLPLFKHVDFFNDVPGLAAKNAHIYLYPGFSSWGMAAYLFLFIPLLVYFVGKRYCAWFCACGNLAETVGVTVWGKKWVRFGTPRGDKAEKGHVVQFVVMFFAIGFGAVLLLDSTKVIAASNFVARLQAVQDFGVDFIFGSVIGIAAYPFFGTRVWCRYGCPLAKFMEVSGRYTKSRFQVAANEKCTGIGLCTQACPMGIDVASYAHENKKPTHGHFGLEQTVCIGCGGCIDVCPTKALAFGKHSVPVAVPTPPPPPSSLRIWTPLVGKYFS